MEYKPLKVAAYCRVSTKSENQKHSLEAQCEYYTCLIQENPNWKFMGVYIDDSSGRSHEKMLGFKKLLADCRKKKVDVIITKSISRFGRNTLDFLKTLYFLKELNVDVWFEAEQIKLSSQNNMFDLAIRVAIVQNESESKSENIKWGILRSFKNPESKYYSRICYGYRRNAADHLEPYPEQAEIVRQIFEWYLEGHSLSGISKILFEKQILSPSGKASWSSETISSVLSNEKYTGSVLLQKTYIGDFFLAKQVKNKGQLPQ
jgi:DNA invertase Pin-like site-specific DNA recombinase